MRWKRWNTPYVDGGLQDQPIRLFQRMNTAVRLFEAISAWNNKYTPTLEADRLWYALHKDDMALMHHIWNKVLPKPE